MSGSADGPERERDSAADEVDGGYEWTVADVGRDVGTSVVLIFLIGGLLFALAGTWPPMVAVESGSMNPNLQQGDLVFVTSPDRFAPESDFGETGVVTRESGRRSDHRSFGRAGSVIIYDSPDRSGSPVIHRASFWVDAGENWYSKANASHVQADSCRELNYCPAPHAGFVTKGDNNLWYDQVTGLAPPVKPEWIGAVARVRIPYLGCIRLGLGENSCIYA